MRRGRYETVTVQKDALLKFDHRQFRATDPAVRAFPNPGGETQRRDLGRSWPPPLRIATPADAEVRIGVIHNARARHNLLRAGPSALAGCEQATPQSHEELDAALAEFATAGVNALIIDGGDGTVRDVMSIAPRHYSGTFPRIAIVPSGKTNALALDLGLPKHWTAKDAIEAIRFGGIKERSPIEIWRVGGEQPDLRGFIFGAGAFVRATSLAQTTHRFGAFNGLAVALSITGAVAQTLFGGRDNSWRRGEAMSVAMSDDTPIDAAQYMLLGSTLVHMPLKVRPFGEPRAGMKMLRIESSPRRIVAALPALLGGGEPKWLAQAGYHRADAENIDVRLTGGFILDGETFPGGDMTLRQGAPMRFVVP